MLQMRNGFIVEQDGYLRSPEYMSGRGLRVKDVIVLVVTMLGFGAALLAGEIFDNVALFFLFTGISLTALGAYSYSNKERRYPEEKVRGLIAPLGGVFAVLLSAVLLAVPISYDAREIIVISMVMFGVLLMIAALLFFGVAQRSIRKNRCTENVIATCIGLVRHYRKGGDVYSPVWEFPFEGRKVTCMEKTPSAHGIPHTGDLQLIYVNPDDYPRSK